MMYELNSLQNMTLGELKGLAKALGVKSKKEIIKELPDWYGIPGIKFQFVNEWADPLIWWKGKSCSCYIVEDTMWERFREEKDEAEWNLFNDYMRDNKDEVYELCDLAMGFV